MKKKILSSSAYEFFEASKRSKGTPSMSVISAGAFGTRLKFNPSFWEGFEGELETVQLKSKNNRILIAEKFSDEGVNFKISKGHIYNAGLVRAVIEKFDLDMEGKTSITFHDITFKHINNDDGERVLAAIVKIKSEGDSRDDR